MYVCGIAVVLAGRFPPPLQPGFLLHALPTPLQGSRIKEAAAALVAVVVAVAAAVVVVVVVVVVLLLLLLLVLVAVLASLGNRREGCQMKPFLVRGVPVAQQQQQQ